MVKPWVGKSAELKVAYLAAKKVEQLVAYLASKTAQLWVVVRV
jgi:hypothetical protein